ncbi:MAG: hypothetical protein ACYTAF_03895 [Planctomycetota bacterium]|jgi:hypothetical protein
MKKIRLLAAPLLALVLAGGCGVHVVHRSYPVRRPAPPPTVVVEEPPVVDIHVPSSPPRSEAHVEVGWSDVRTVIWREYYGCDAATVEYLRDLRGYDSADILFFLHVARWASVPVRDVVLVYRTRCGSSLHGVLLHYSVPVTVVYVDLPSGFRCPPPYRRPYDCYWNRGRRPGFRLTNVECRLLVELRIAYQYYGFSATTYFGRYTEVSGREKHAFRHIARKDRHCMGRGGVDVRGKPLRRERGTSQRGRERSGKAKDRPRARGTPRHGNAAPPEVDRTRRKAPGPKPKAKRPAPKPKAKAKPPTPKPKAASESGAPPGGSRKKKAGPRG